jgi:WhiB family redox-sensing transcriptional regulator
MAETRRLPRPVTAAWDWQLRAACRELDNEFFFHPEGERGQARARRERHAKAICRRCPVIAQCRAHAMAALEPYGIWGGLSKLDRDMITEPAALAGSQGAATNGHVIPL